MCFFRKNTRFSFFFRSCFVQNGFQLVGVYYAPYDVIHFGYGGAPAPPGGGGRDGAPPGGGG